MQPIVGGATPRKDASMLHEFSRDFLIAFIAYSALLGVLLINLGIILAWCAQKVRDKSQRDFAEQLPLVYNGGRRESTPSTSFKKSTTLTSVRRSRWRRGCGRA